MVRGLCRMALKQQFRTIEVTGQENISEDAGILTVAWHTNALIDSSTIFVTDGGWAEWIAFGSSDTEMVISGNPLTAGHKSASELGS